MVLATISLLIFPIVVRAFLHVSAIRRNVVPVIEHPFRGDRIHGSIKGVFSLRMRTVKGVVPYPRGMAETETSGSRGVFGEQVLRLFIVGTLIIIIKVCFGDRVG